MKKELTIREVAKLGGLARARKLSKKRRKEIAQMGAQARIRNLSTGLLASKTKQV